MRGTDGRIYDKRFDHDRNGKLDPGEFCQFMDSLDESIEYDDEIEDEDTQPVIHSGSYDKKKIGLLASRFPLLMNTFP